VTRVERLAGELGLSMRGLQRLFAEYVGIGPKWVIRRYRLHEVTAHTWTWCSASTSSITTGTGRTSPGSSGPRTSKRRSAGT
jgi:transcriptional regulator GlxA family with amidase domain